jgi:23S rRNA (uridine2552-2'-O)-methyltransferase
VLHLSWNLGLDASSMAFNPKDRFFHMAKKDGFVARSAYKLDEVQKKYKLIKPGNFVLDLGAAPGAWSQIAQKIVGPSGRVVGIDLKPISLSYPNATFHVMDVFQMDPAILGSRPIDVLLSDMAPNTTGIRSADQARSEELCREVLKVSDQFLRPGGHLMLKLFVGPEADEIAKGIKDRFEEMKRIKPEAVRKGSFEIYVVGFNKRREK